MFYFEEKLKDGESAILPNAPPHADERDPPLAKHSLPGIVDLKAFEQKIGNLTRFIHWADDVLLL